MKSFILIGHVDHGKTTIGNNILTRFGIATELDDAEEKERSKTQQFSFINLNENLRLIDTPGHKIYIRSMIEGVSTFSTNCVGVLVVSARANEYEKGIKGGQIKEVLTIVKAVGISSIIVFINKTDLLETAERDNRLQFIQTDLEKTLKSFRFTNVVFLHGSGATGDGVSTLIDTIKDIRVEDVEEKHPSVTSRKFIAKTHLLYLNGIMSVGYRCVLHCLNQECECEIVGLQKDRKNVVFCRKGESPVVKIATTSPLNLELKSRFILRKDNDTIGFGVIEKVFPQK